MRLINVKEVANKLGVSTRTVYRMVDTGYLPSPIKLGSRSQRWVEHEVDEHLMNLPRGKKCEVGFLPDAINCA